MLDKRIKQLLLIINKAGIEINLEVITRYSEKFDAMTNEYHLKKWNKRKVKDKETGETKDQWYCIDKQFGRQDQIAKYLMAIKNNNGI